MKRKSSKAWIITAVIVAMLVLISAMAGCTPKDKKKKSTDTYQASAALVDVLEAAENTLGKIKDNSGDVSLGLSVGVKGEKLKLNVNEGDIQLNVGGENGADFDAKVKIGANFSEKTSTNNEIKAEVLLDNVVKLGLYSKDNVVYIQDGVTTASTQKLKVSGATAVGYNQYLDDLPGILKNALGGLDLSALKETVAGFGDVVDNLIEAKKTNDGVSLEVVFLSDDPAKGLGGLLEVFGDEIKFKTIIKSNPELGEQIDGLIDTYLPYILGGSFSDFSAGKVKATSKISIDVGIKNKELTGLGIVIDLDPIKSVKDVGGKITIEIGDLVVDNKKTDVLPSDLDSYAEGAVTANLALNIPGNDKLQLSAKIEFSPSLVDRDLKVKVVASAKGKDGQIKEVDLKGGYVNLGTSENPDYAIVFDIGYLYEISGVPLPEDGITTYKYSVNAGLTGSMGLGDFLESLIKSQRVFVFFDEIEGGFWEDAAGVNFFKANGTAFAASDLAEITAQVKDYYEEKYGGEADDYEVEYRYADGTLALDKTGKGDFVGRKAELGYNLDLTAIVTVKDSETYTGKYTRGYVEVTFKSGVGAEAGNDKTVIVRTGETLNISHFAPEYAVSSGYDFGRWQIGGEDVSLEAITLTEKTTVMFTATNVGSLQKTVYKTFDMQTDLYVDYAVRYYSKDGKNIMIETATVPEVPVIFGMNGEWAVISVISDEGKDSTHSVSIINRVSETETAPYSAYVDNGVVNIYPVYEVKADANWKDYGEGAEKLEARFVRKTLNGGKVTSIFEEGDRSLVGQGAVGAVLNRLGDVFGIIKNKSVDAKFVLEIMAKISPYLASEDLIADRILNAFLDYDEKPLIRYPYMMPSLQNDEAVVSASDVAALETGKGVLTKQKKPNLLVSGFKNNYKNAVIWATYQRFVGLYGYLEESDYADWCWDGLTEYKGTPEEKAAIYAKNEESSYNEKVKQAQKKFRAAVEEQEINEKILDYVKTVLGKDVVGSITSVKEFIFGSNSVAPLKVDWEIAKPTADSGYGVTVKLMRGDTVLASIGGDVFLSKMADITDLNASDFADAKDVTDGSILEELRAIANGLLEGEAEDEVEGEDAAA